MPARGGHFDRSHQELLLGFSLCLLGSGGFSLFCGRGVSLCFLVSSGFFFLGGLGGSFFFLGHLGWLGFGLGSCGSSGRCWSGCSSRSGSRLGSGSLCVCTNSEEASDQSSEDFVHLEFPW